MDEARSAEVLALLRRQRHSFLNHLQVISGWLQLNRPERARQHLEAVAARMTAESDLLSRVSPPVALALMELMQDAETHGVQVEWRMKGRFEPAGEESLREFVAKVATALGSASTAAEEERRITVFLGADGFAVHTLPVNTKG